MVLFIDAVEYKENQRKKYQTIGKKRKQCIVLKKNIIRVQNKL